jgi:hypothetical protein
MNILRSLLLVGCIGGASLSCWAMDFAREVELEDDRIISPASNTSSESDKNVIVALNSTHDGNHLIAGHKCGKITIWEIDKKIIRFNYGKPFQEKTTLSISTLLMMANTFFA